MNNFTSLDDLTNEASVEQFLVARLLSDLGYADRQVRPKSSLAELSVSAGRRRVRFRPDYALVVAGRVRWVCEVKAPDENLDRWGGQCSSYCLELNRGEVDNPVEMYVLTNGVTTRVYRWDKQEPLVEVAFHQMVDGNERYEVLRDLLSPKHFRQPAPPIAPSDGHVLRRQTVSDLNADFAWAHRLIYKRENLSYTAAFMEFVKVTFLKLLSDRKAHESTGVVEVDGGVAVPVDDVTFSSRWIQSRERDTPNPLDQILFQDLLRGLETEIRAGRKKRIFPREERLNLSADTVRALVDRFQHTDLISLDADLNGRMFETFLNSTLRGKALGQYFTPRSVVKLATGLAQLRATPDHLDVVLDACCGTGGFLIEALAVMWARIDANTSLTDKEREALRDRVAGESLFGVDVARDPALARIARINMYLHGDGGSRIYQLDALDQKVSAAPGEDPEIAREKSELREHLAAYPQGFADVALTNPPFAKDYSRETSTEGQLLDDYELSFDTAGGGRRPLTTVSSMILFLERYHGLLVEGGRLITVVDDSILGSSRHKALRQWVRDRWLVRAVVSLPGDAFQRSQARVKTSVLVLEKRALRESQSQPSAFMYYCTAVGVDDAPRQRILPMDEVNRGHAKQEIKEVAELYAAFQRGDEIARPWSVPASALQDRLDVKACLLKAGRRVQAWREAGLEVVTVDDLVVRVTAADDPMGQQGRALQPDEDELVTYLRVRYDGFTEPGDEVWTSDVGASRLTRVREGDLVISHINAVHGAVGVVPPEHDGFVVTSEYTVCSAKDGLDARVVWSLMRSPESRADLLLLATGIGRTRIRWTEARRLQLPRPTAGVATRILDNLDRADRAEREVGMLRQEAERVVQDELALDTPEARAIIAAFKPPR